MLTAIEHHAFPALARSVVEIVVFVSQQLFIKTTQGHPQGFSEAGEGYGVHFFRLRKARRYVEAILGIPDSEAVRNCNGDCSSHRSFGAGSYATWHTDHRCPAIVEHSHTASNVS